MTAPELADETGKPFRRLMIAQDVGSAIRGPERGDIFFGTGEAAGAIAGGSGASGAVLRLAAEALKLSFPRMRESSNPSH